MRNDVVQPRGVAGGVVLAGLVLDRDDLSGSLAKDAANLRLPRGAVKRLHVRLGLRAVGHDLAQLAVDLHRQHRADAHLNAVQVVGHAALERHHLPHVREVVLQAGRRAGNLGVRHRRTGDDQPLGDGLHRVRIALRDAVRRVDDLLQRRAHQLRDALAVILAGDDVRDAPFADRDVLRHHVAQARPKHAHRRLREDFRIEQDSFRTVVVQRDLDVVDLHRGGIRGVAVHGGRGADDGARHADRVAQHLAGVVDHAGADRQQHVAARVVVHDDAADLPLRRGDPLPGDDIAAVRDARRVEDLADAPSSDLIGVFIADDEGLFFAHRSDHIGHIFHDAAADLQIFQLADMVFAAFAIVALRAHQRFQRHFVKFRHKYDLAFAPILLYIRRIARRSST